MQNLSTTTPAMRSRLRRKLLTLTIAQALMCTSALAATITVDFASDPDGVSSRCSLRNAVASANTDIAVGGCVAGAGIDTIDFDPAILPAAIALNSQLVLRSAVSVQGPGAEQLTIFGGYSSGRVFLVQTSSASVTLSGLTVADGDVNGAGGGIANYGNLTIDGCVVSDNSSERGGGIHNENRLTILNSSIHGNAASNSGGGISNVDGTTTITNSEISNNEVDGGGGGGGLYNLYGFVTISDSVFDRNATSRNGGAIRNVDGVLSLSRSSISNNYALDDGGGLESNGGARVEDSTFAGNTADIGGALYLASNDVALNVTLSGNTATDNGAAAVLGAGSPSLANATITRNHARGQYSAALVSLVDGTVRNSIIANTTGGLDCLATFDNGTIRPDMSDSLIADGSCPNSGDNLISGDPMLGPLQDNGGETLTYALLPASPAIDTGNNASCADTDQTGLPRPVDGDADGTATCDLGAFEYVDFMGPLAVLNIAPDVVDQSNPTFYAVILSYSDPSGINVASIDSADLIVTGPNGQLTTIAANSNADGSLVSYQLQPPDGTWTGDDSGLYTINLNADEVFDLAADANAAEAGATGQLQGELARNRRGQQGRAHC